MKPELLILVVTLANEQRRAFLARLKERLEPQMSKPRWSAWALEDGKQATIGDKRQWMLNFVQHRQWMINHVRKTHLGLPPAPEPFVFFHDDDDLPTEDYCALIEQAIDSGADVVGFRVGYFVDGQRRGSGILSVKCERWGERALPDGQREFFRTPNHLSPVRLSFATQTGFRAINHGEDADYSHRMYAKFGKDMKEVFIDKEIYKYEFRGRAFRRDR